jgi:hypothetical protein
VAAAAVQQAEHALLKCKAAALSPALLQQRQQPQQQGGIAGRTGPSGSSSSSSRRKGLLFELAGVHCCCQGGGPNSAPAKRRVSRIMHRNSYIHDSTRCLYLQQTDIHLQQKLHGMEFMHGGYLVDVM